MPFLIGLLVGYALGIVCGLGVVVYLSSPARADTILPRHLSPRRSYPRRAPRPDVRKIVLRPVNKDEPPSRITQALFRQRPTRKLDD